MWSGGSGPVHIAINTSPGNQYPGWESCYCAKATTRKAGITANLKVLVHSLCAPSLRRLTLEALPITGNTCLTPVNVSFCFPRNSRVKTMTGWTPLNSRSLLAGWGGADRKRVRNHRSIRGSLRGSMDIMLLYQYACACGQPVISGLPLQHVQGALLLL